MATPAKPGPAGACVEVVRTRWDRPACTPVVPLLLLVGAPGAVASSATGRVLALGAYPRPSLRWAPEWHRRSGITAMVPAAGAAWIAHRLADAATPGGRWLRRFAVGSPPTALLAAAHPGAMMVWGEDYFDTSE